MSHLTQDGSPVQVDHAERDLRNEQEKRAEAELNQPSGLDGVGELLEEGAEALHAGLSFVTDSLFGREQSSPEPGDRSTTASPSERVEEPRQSAPPETDTQTAELEEPSLLSRAANAVGSFLGFGRAEQAPESAASTWERLCSAASSFFSPVTGLFGGVVSSVGSWFGSAIDSVIDFFDDPPEESGSNTRDTSQKKDDSRSESKQKDRIVEQTDYTFRNLQQEDHQERSSQPRVVDLEEPVILSRHHRGGPEEGEGSSDLAETLEAFGRAVREEQEAEAEDDRTEQEADSEERDQQVGKIAVLNPNLEAELQVLLDEEPFEGDRSNESLLHEARLRAKLSSELA